MYSDEELGKISALQLLLGDLSPTDRLHLIRCAFHDDALVFLGSNESHNPSSVNWFRDEMRSMHNVLSRSLEICDGSSGLGAHTARNLHAALAAAVEDLRDAAKAIGLSI